MTAENTAATATADPSAAPATTTAAPDTPPATNPTAQDGTQPAPPAEGADTDTATTTAPEAYTFEMPEGMTLDEGLAGKVTPILREANVSQELAQKLASAFAEHIKAANEGAGEAFDKAYAERKQKEDATNRGQWMEQLKADAELGGAKFESVKARAIEAVGAVGTPEMKAAFDENGWGNHPELVRLVHRLIDYVPPEKGERAAGGGGAERRPEQVLWPDLPAR